MIQSLSAEHNQQVESLLMGLLVKAEAIAVFLCDRGGNIMAQHSSQIYRQEDTIAALASGSFYATRVLAELLGEAEFKQCVHQGHDTGMYMQSMACDMMILVVFGRDSNPGLVKLYCNEICQNIDRLAAADRGFAGSEHVPSGDVFEMDESKPLFTRSQ